MVVYVGTIYDDEIRERMFFVRDSMNNEITIELTLGGNLKNDK